MILMMEDQVAGGARDVQNAPPGFCYSSASYADVVASLYGAKLSSVICWLLTIDDWIVSMADSTAVTSGFSYFMSVTSSH
jgi:hypothetical protein